MSRQIIVTNRRARRDYEITETVEAGIVLQGTEVKALRKTGASLAEAFCVVSEDQVLLLKAHISPYSHGSDFASYEPARARKLLLRRRQVRYLSKMVERKGYTMVPLSLYFRDGWAKVEIGLARGKRRADKRAALAERDTKRELEQTLKGYQQT